MLSYPVLLLQIMMIRARALRADDNRERGASAIEWAVIAAITVVAAVLIGGVVYKIVSTNSDTLTNCTGATTPGKAC